jgi:hypothetical protein
MLPAKGNREPYDFHIKLHRNKNIALIPVQSSLEKIPLTRDHGLR